MSVVIDVEKVCGWLNRELDACRTDANSNANLYASGRFDAFHAFMRAMWNGEFKAND